MHIYVQTYIHNTYIYIYIHNTYIHTFIHSFIHSFIYACIHTYIYIHNTHTYIHIYIHITYIHSYTYIPTYIHTCIYTYICTYVCTAVHKRSPMPPLLILWMFRSRISTIILAILTAVCRDLPQSFHAYLGSYLSVSGKAFFQIVTPRTVHYTFLNKISCKGVVV